MSRRPTDGLIFPATLFAAIAIAGTISYFQNATPDFAEGRADYFVTVTTKRLPNSCRVAEVSRADCDKVLTDEASESKADEHL